MEKRAGYDWFAAKVFRADLYPIGEIVIGAARPYGHSTVLVTDQQRIPVHVPFQCGDRAIVRRDLVVLPRHVEIGYVDVRTPVYVDVVVKIERGHPRNDVVGGNLGQTLEAHVFLHLFILELSFPGLFPKYRVH